MNQVQKEMGIMNYLITINFPMCNVYQQLNYQSTMFIWYIAEKQQKRKRKISKKGYLKRCDSNCTKYEVHSNFLNCSEIQRSECLVQFS